MLTGVKVKTILLRGCLFGVSFSSVSLAGYLSVMTSRVWPREPESKTGSSLSNSPPPSFITRGSQTSNNIDCMHIACNFAPYVRRFTYYTVFYHRTIVEHMHKWRLHDSVTQDSHNLQLVIVPTNLFWYLAVVEFETQAEELGRLVAPVRIY